MSKYDDDIDLWFELYKRRYGFGPFYLGAAIAIVGGLTSFLTTAQTAIVLTAITAASTGLIYIKIKNTPRRAYALTVLFASAAWVMIAHELVPGQFMWIATAWLSATVLLGLPWWASNRKQSQVRMEETVQDWPKLSRRIGLGQTGMTGVVVTPTGYRGKLTWPGGVYDVDSVLRMQSGLEGVLGADRGSVSLELDGKSPSSVRFAVVTQDPHAVAQPWPLPTHLRRGVDPIVTGIRTDGEYRRIQRFTLDAGARHALIGGQSESGKSSLINVVVASDVCSEDTFPIGLDFKRVELGPWRPALGYVTSDLDEAADLILAFGAPGGVIDERAKIMEEKGKRVWNPAWGPWIGITVDETRDFVSSMNGAAMNAWIRIKTQGRAAGIATTEATQYPTLAAVGSSQSRQQNRYGFCFRMLDSEGESYVIPGHRVYAERIPGDRPGTCFMREAENVDTMAQRILYIDDDTRDAVVQTRAGETVPLDERTEAAIVRLFPAFADRDRWYRESDGTLVRESADVERDSERESSGTPGQGDSRSERESTGVERDSDRESGGTGTEPDTDLADIIAARRARLTPEERDSEQRERESILANAAREDPDAPGRLQDLLIKAGDRGMTAKEVQVGVGRSSSWFYKQAERLQAEGALKRVAHGRWAWVEPSSRDAESPSTTVH